MWQASPFSDLYVHNTYNIYIDMSGFRVCKYAAQIALCEIAHIFCKKNQKSLLVVRLQNICAANIYVSCTLANYAR